MKQLLQTEFRKYGGSISLDAWTDKTRKATFFGLTVHFISCENGKLVLNDRVLVIRELSAETKNGEYLKEKVDEYLEEFNLMQYVGDKIIFVSDRGTNIVKALASFESINCFAHLIHNTVEKILDKNVTVRVVTSIVKYFKINGINSLFEKTLKSNVATRWNSVLRMLESFIEVWDAISEILNQPPSSRPSDKEKDRLRAKHSTEFNTISLSELILLRDFLQPFKTATDEVEATKKPTLHLVHPWYLELHAHMQPSVLDPTMIAAFKSTGLMYWTNTVKNYVTNFHDVATFLHPEMKGLKFLTSQEKSKVWEKTREMMEELAPLADRFEPIAAQQVVHPRSARALRHFYDEDDDDLNGGTQEPNEIEEYKVLKVRTEVNLLEWWEGHKTTFPQLYRVARFIHSIPGSSAAAERMFSKAGRLVTFRPNMRSELVDEILFLKSNYDLFDKSRVLYNDEESDNTSDNNQTVEIDVDR